MSEAILILLNMRGGCATVGDKVHTLFHVNNRCPRQSANSEKKAEGDVLGLNHPVPPKRPATLLKTKNLVTVKPAAKIVDQIDDRVAMSSQNTTLI